MAWTTPPTLTDGQVLTGAHTQIWRDDLNLTAPALATTQGQFFVATGANATAARLAVVNAVITVETTTSTSYTGLTTFGPQAVVTSGNFCLVGISCKMTQNTNGTNCITSYAISGATTVAASDLAAINHQFASATADTLRCSAVTMQSSLTPGSNSFTMQYRVSGGTGSFDSRQIWVIPF